MQDIPQDQNNKVEDTIRSCGFDPIKIKGIGTYGIVYQVNDANENIYAFKYCRSNDTYDIDNLAEIDVLSRIYHPHIIHVHKIITPLDCNIDNIALILPLGERTLHDILSDPSSTTDVKLPILFKLASALDFMHKSGILHLDIKASNVILQDIKSNNPKFIDFGIGMLVDDASIGQESPYIHVTFDHRAPEILNGSNIYNAPVDVWAFGIMMLYILSSKEIYISQDLTLSPKDFYTIVVKTFTDKTTISSLLTNVRPKYQALCIDLLSKILVIDPTKRLTARQICNHPVFDEFRTVVTGGIDIPPITTDYSKDHRDIIKLIIHWSMSYHNKDKVKLLFLAIDLFNRVGSFYKDKSPQERITISATCIWMASKLVSSKLVHLDPFIREINIMAPHITSKQIYQAEFEIINHLNGVLNVLHLYNACDNLNDLKISFNNIVLDKDSTLYGRVDVPSWSKILKQLPQTPLSSQPKSVDIETFMNVIK